MAGTRWLATVATMAMALSVSGFEKIQGVNTLRSPAFVNGAFLGKTRLARDVEFVSWRPPHQSSQTRFGAPIFRKSSAGVCSATSLIEGFAAATHLGAILTAVDLTTAGAFVPDVHNLLADAAAAVNAGTASATASATAAATAAASSSADAADAAAKASSPGIFDSFVNLIEQSLILLHSSLKTAGVPGAWGLSIIMFTVLVKVLTYPLNYKQMVSTIQMQNLQPKIKALQSRYQNDPQRLNQMTSKLYQDEQVNPLAGCLPTLVQIPVFIALYRSLLDLAKKDLLTESFLWIPSLEGPVGEYSPTTGLPIDGTAWLFKGWTEGHPAMGWEDTIAYLSIPIILVLTQTLSQKALQPPPSDDPAQQQTQMILKFLPLMIGWFSLNVPAGLGIYWVINNVLSTGQQYFIKQSVKASMPAPAGPAAGADSSESLRTQLKAASSAAAAEVKFKATPKKSTATLTAPAAPAAPKPKDPPAQPQDVPAATPAPAPAAAAPAAPAPAAVAAPAAASPASSPPAAAPAAPSPSGGGEPSKTALKKKAKATKGKKNK